MITFILFIIECVLCVANAIIGLIHFCRAEKLYKIVVVMNEPKDAIQVMKHERFLSMFYFAIAGGLIIIANIQAIVI